MKKTGYVARPRGGQKEWIKGREQMRGSGNYNRLPGCVWLEKDHRKREISQTSVGKVKAGRGLAGRERLSSRLHLGGGSLFGLLL